MRALLNVYYCLDDTTLSCLCVKKKKPTEKAPKEVEQREPSNMMTAFCFLF